MDEIKTADFEVEITDLDFESDIEIPEYMYMRYVNISWSAIGKDEEGEFKLFQIYNGHWFFDAYPYDQDEDRTLCAAILRALPKSKLSNRIYNRLNIKNSFENIFNSLSLADDDFYDSFD
ncbi:hypothetical protein [Succinivibrio dextrinosolvens]|uniref:hypothetical protein n=1 Tax=Succinivibrio dextrinosolvens TaxID=83771 RepID=UPI00241E5B27|nr:hypothetical protein [Succinivibrio dextrinosolvens]MBE6424184.1 hypothetical protein [Succinivibrio dextrinosolvens]